MKYIRLNDVNDKFFVEAWFLYELSFPPEERRLINDHLMIMNKPDYNFDVIIKGTELVGIFFWWDFDNLSYIEHFATNPTHRNQGLGKSILQNFIRNNPNPILLEVEIPDNDIKLRRISFYKRVGFKLNKHPYSFPPMQEGMPPLELYLMTYPEEISEKNVTDFKKKYHPILLNINKEDLC